MNYPACDWCGECKCCPRHDCEECRKKEKERKEFLAREFDKCFGTAPRSDEL